MCHDDVDVDTTMRESETTTLKKRNKTHNTGAVLMIMSLEPSRQDKHTRQTRPEYNDVDDHIVTSLSLLSSFLLVVNT